MRIKLVTIAVAAAIAMPLGALAAASDPPSRPAPSADRNPIDRTADTGAGTFLSFDTNKDGHVSRDEAKNSAELSRQFNQLDKDGDGKLSPQELSGWRAGTPSSTGSGSMGEGKVGASGSSGVGSSTERSGGIRDSGSPPPASSKRGY